MIFIVMKKALNRAMYRLYDHTWSVIGVTIALLYLSGFAVMEMAGEADIVDNYTWWFTVTITTVGYGDYAPATTPGRLTAGVIMFVGIGAIGLLIGKLAEFILEIANRKAKGLGIMKHEDHIVIMGYRNGGTEKLISELRANNKDEEIVLCSREQSTNPAVAQDIDFVRGDLASADVLYRANVQAAKSIIIHGHDDDQTFFAAYAVREVNQSAHLVCYLNNEHHAGKIRRLPAKDPSFNQVVLPVYDFLMAQELQDRESSAVIHDLISNLSGENLYRYDLPEDAEISCSYLDVFMGMKRHYNATTLAIKDGELCCNPELTMPVRAGTTIFYTAAHRIPRIDVANFQNLSTTEQ